MRGVGLYLVAALASLAALVAACGSSNRLAPAAEPATSPPLEREPAGTVVPLGDEPEGLAVDPSTGLPEAATGPRRVAATADRAHIGVVRRRERALELFDARTRESEAKVGVGIGPTHVVGGRGRFFVVDTRGNALLEVRLDPLRVHRRTHLGGTPYGIAHDKRRRRYWVTLTALNQVAELTDRRVLRRFPTVRQPNSVAVDPRSGRVFVAGHAEGMLQFFDPPPCRGDECDQR
jgi:hypothetical protein